MRNSESEPDFEAQTKFEAGSEFEAGTQSEPEFEAATEFEPEAATQNPLKISRVSARRVKTEAAPGSNPNPGEDKNLVSRSKKLDPEDSAANGVVQGSLRWYQAQKPPHWG